MLAPNYALLSHYKLYKDERYYVEHFVRCLRYSLNQNDVVEDLFELAENSDIALVCYEKTGDFCHRHLVASWLMEANFDVIEFRKYK